jgi:hypothetical protein
MMIRPAVPADFPAMLEMGKTQHLGSEWAKRDTPFDEDSFTDYLGQAIQTGLALVADNGERVVGMFGGNIGAPAFNRNIQIFLGTFWYCEPEFRKEAGLPLLTAGEKAVKARGVRFGVVSTDDGEDSAALNRLYRRVGYQFAEQVFLKEL